MKTALFRDGHPIKNVGSALAGHDQFVPIPVDRTLGYWALTSTAIRNRNLKLALNFARQRQQAADAGELKEERLRSGMAQYLLALVMEEQEADSQAKPRWSRKSPAKTRP